MTSMTCGSSMSRQPVRSAKASPSRKSWLPRIRSTGTSAETVSASAASISGMGRAGVVVPEPQIEHVAEEVEPIRPPHGAGEKPQERRDRGPG